MLSFNLNGEMFFSFSSFPLFSRSSLLVSSLPDFSSFIPSSYLSLTFSCRFSPLFFTIFHCTPYCILSFLVLHLFSLSSLLSFILYPDLFSFLTTFLVPPLFLRLFSFHLSSPFSVLLSSLLSFIPPFIRSLLSPHLFLPLIYWFLFLSPRLSPQLGVC